VLFDVCAVHLFGWSTGSAIFQGWWANGKRLSGILPRAPAQDIDIGSLLACATHTKQSMVPLHAVCASGLTDAAQCQGLFMALWCLKEARHCNPTDDPILLTVKTYPV
jgi:hypothetical protein